MASIAIIFLSRISSLIEPKAARIDPVFSSSNLGHNTPGVSNRSNSLSACSQVKERVTPGLSAAFSVFFPAMRLIIVDLPTLGIPAAIARTARGLIPFALCLSLFSFMTFKATWMIFFPHPGSLIKSTAIQDTFSLCSFFSQSSVCTGSA